MVLGLIVIVTAGILVSNYFKDKGAAQRLPLELNTSQDSTGTNFGKTHTVVKGESLWQIAEKEIGSGYNWTDIAKENHLTNPSLIYAGQKLAIPSVEPLVLTKGETTLTKTTVANPISGATYEVVKGDTLWSIALRAYGDGYQWSEIARENKLANPSLIHPGNIIVLPR